ncbi:MAG: MFS transporter [Pelagibacteraceae bacterium]|jgi:UMF1 family MFS transporter|nr:MFS transporter [Pelagibacteraceae bacterium]MDP6784542.1 MFS transporter [Alphaproteobacteria bacterium]MBO6468384.1 MFS transporter [Pelagibacteraceae bacterium]MBO6470604.1 MFS transporter [Pelagibacteraceae bacterium]MBO6471670.1 MFS transporter [Pelagibacteraceae bacterium]
MNNRFNVRFSWSVYDWANSAWSAIIITFIFAEYFVNVLAPDKDLGTLYWTWTIGLSSLVAALLSPILGSISDQSQRSKYWLILSTFIYSFIAFSFWFAQPKGMDLFLIIFLLFIGNISYEISQIFYNGQLKLITTENNYAKLSGFAWGLGYAGTVIIFIIYYGIFLLPEDPIFTLDKTTYENIRISFPITGAWILIFSLPLFISFKDPKSDTITSKFNIKKSFNQIIITFKDLRKYKNIIWFLIARLFYMDGINAIFAVAAIYAATVFGMSTTDIIMLGIGTNFAAGIGSWVFSFIENKIGSKNIIVFSLICIFIISFAILLINQKNTFIILAICLSTFFGPIQSASRVYFAKFIPDEKKYEFFGFYSFSGKVTSFIGPILYGTITYTFSSPKLGMASLLVLFAVGLLLLTKVENDHQIE